MDKSPQKKSYEFSKLGTSVNLAKSRQIGKYFIVAEMAITPEVDIGQ